MKCISRGLNLWINMSDTVPPRDPLSWNKKLLRVLHLSSPGYPRFLSRPVMLGTGRKKWRFVEFQSWSAPSVMQSAGRN